jgi:hypothetical protein
MFHVFVKHFIRCQSSYVSLNNEQLALDHMFHADSIVRHADTRLLQLYASKTLLMCQEPALTAP